MTTDRHSKKDAKQQKIFCKNDSLNILNRQKAERELRDLEEGRSEEMNEDPSYRKAKRFWSKNDEKYFKTLTLNDFSEAREKTQSNELGFSEVTNFSHYREQFIDSAIPSIKDSSTLKVLFKSDLPPFPSAIVSYSIESSVPNYHTEQGNILVEQGIKIKNMSQKSTTKQQNQSNTKNADFSSRNLRLNLEEFSDDMTLCQKIGKYSQMEKSYIHDIDKEIAMWEWQLNRVNQQNNITWNNLLSKVRENPELLKVKNQQDYQKQIFHIQNKLLWSTVLRSFQAGFRDKTKKMLENYIQNEKNFNMKPPKGLGSAPKKYFQTDCKICFCSDNNDSNQVLYCDSCNTSYHLACYGLHSIPKEDPYFCQRCAFIKKQGYTGARAKNIHCQICSKNNFPMKKIDDHFYHITCLILFNFVEFGNNRMKFRGALSHQKILDLVIQNQVMSEDCDYCRKPIHAPGTNSIGMKIKCSYDENCNNYYHPICAYLNGCKFIVAKTLQEKLEVRLVCNAHFSSRSEQVYLRRYMLNVNDASEKKQSQFEKDYQNEMVKRKQVKQATNMFKNRYPNRILYVTKFMKNYLKSKEERQDDKIQTETQRLLKRIQQSHITPFL